jgi:hypothetical protein
MKKTLLVLLTACIMICTMQSCDNDSVNKHVETFNYTVVDKIIQDELFSGKYKSEIFTIIDNSNVTEDEKLWLKKKCEATFDVELATLEYEIHYIMTNRPEIAEKARLDYDNRVGSIKQYLYKSHKNYQNQFANQHK